MDYRPTTVERALQLAAGGGFATVTEIKTALKREGFAGIDATFDGAAIREQLRALMGRGKAARLEAAAANDGRRTMARND